MSIDFGMYTHRGNAAVANIVKVARGLEVWENVPGREGRWAYAERQLINLAKRPGFTEATDTAVREAVYCTLVPMEAQPADPVREALARVLSVLVLDHTIRAWLAEHDPKALAQARAALLLAGAQMDPVNDRAG